MSRKKILCLYLYHTECSQWTTYICILLIDLFSLIPWVVQSSFLCALLGVRNKTRALSFSLLCLYLLGLFSPSRQAFSGWLGTRPPFSNFSSFLIHNLRDRALLQHQLKNLRRSLIDLTWVTWLPRKLSESCDCLPPPIMFEAGDVQFYRPRNQSVGIGKILLMTHVTPTCVLRKQGFHSFWHLGILASLHTSKR